MESENQDRRLPAEASFAEPLPVVGDLLPAGLAAPLASMLEDSIVGIYLIQDGCFHYVNRRLAEIFGYGPEEMIGLPQERCVWEQDRARVNELLRWRLEGRQAQASFSFRGLRADGVAIDVEVHGAATSYRGRPAVMGMLLDITHRTVAEAALLQLNEDLIRMLEEHEALSEALKRARATAAVP